MAAPPVWIEPDRLVLVTGDAAAPLAAIVDTTTGEVVDGPSGDRLLAASGDGKRIATMAGQGDPVVVRDTDGWLAGDGSQVASIAPPTGSSTAIGFALDSAGQRLVVAWAAEDGTVSLAIHDGGSDWRRVAQPTIDAAVAPWSPGFAEGARRAGRPAPAVRLRPAPPPRRSRPGPPRAA